MRASPGWMRWGSTVRDMQIRGVFRWWTSTSYSSPQLSMRRICSLSTGEEEDFRDDDTHMAATAEKLDLKRYWDIAVIDECQMIADRQRADTPRRVPA